MIPEDLFSSLIGTEGGRPKYPVIKYLPIILLPLSTTGKVADNQISPYGNQKIVTWSNKIRVIDCC
jgi:hypothetical protein